MRAEVWEPIDGICGPCGQISFTYLPVHTATVLMTFDGIAEGPARGLTLKFKRVVVLCGEEECPGTGDRERRCGSDLESPERTVTPDCYWVEAV